MSELLTTARPYAKALFKTAKEQNTLDDYQAMLSNLSIAINVKEVRTLLSNDSLDNKYKADVLVDVLKDSADKNFLRFIKS